MSTIGRRERVPYVAGLGAGVGAYLLGYLVSYLGLSGSVEERLAGFNFVATAFGGEPITPWQAVGWLFYNAHFVRTRIDAGLGGAQSENFIAASESGAVVLLHLLPVVLLLAAGLLLARSEDVEEPEDGTIAGAAVTVGYFPMAVLGVFVFSYEGSIAPDLVTAVLLAGLVYPLVLGAIGGAVGGAVGSD